MKVIQINATYGMGSTGGIVKDLQDVCIKNGIDCETVYSTGETGAHKTVQISNRVDRLIHAFLSRIGGKQGYYSYFSTLKLMKYLESQRPDIIHLHNLHSCYINLPLLLKFAVSKDIAVAVSLHDCWFFTGGCTHFTRVNCYKWKDHCGNCPLRMRGVNAYVYDGTSRVLNDRRYLFGKIKRLAVIGVSKWITEEAKESVLKGHQFYYVHNGVDLLFFHPIISRFKALSPIKGKFLVLAPSNKWFQEINKDTLDFFEDRLTDDMVMVFFGMGGCATRLGKRMIDVGYISSKEQLRDLYCAADVMVNCTREESLSLLNVEAQACGTPVITYNNTGVSETVDGVNSFSVENGNPKALWEALLFVKSKGKKEFAQKCREWVVNEFDKNKNYKDYIRIYNTLLK